MENSVDETMDYRIRVADFYAKIYSCVESQGYPVSVIPFQLLFLRYNKLYSDTGGVSLEQFCEDLLVLKNNNFVQFIYDVVDPETDETFLAVIFERKQFREH